MIKVVLGVIVIVFIFWGVGSYRSQRGSRVAVVNGETISVDEYRNTYEQLLDQYRRQFGNALDEKLLKTLNVRKQALDKLINQRLLLQAADRLNLHVTDQEVVNTIQNIKAFQQDGRFSARRYQRVLAANRLSPEAFEANMRMDLVVSKVRAFVQSTAKVSEAEAREQFNWREEQRRIDYVAFDPASYRDITISPEDLKAYFASHQEAYQAPAKIKVAYVRVGFKDLESQSQVQEEDISQYFEQNRDHYGTPKKVRARHILFRLDPDAPQETLDAVRAKAQKVLDQARAGADLAKLAEKYSEDPGSKKRGGDLGFFTRDKMVKPFSDAAFSMKPGQISDLVATRFGWHIIKVEAVQQAKEPVLSEVHDKIRDKLVQDAARTLAYDKAEALYDATYGAHLMDVAKKKGLEVHETDFFDRRGAVEGIKPSGKFTELAFSLDDDEVSEPLELSDGYYLLEVVERKEATIPPLEAVAEKVREDLLDVRRDEAARKAAEQFLAAVKKEDKAFDQQAQTLKLEVKTTEFFTRSGSIPGIGFERELVTAAFSLSTFHPFPEEVIKGRKAYYVIRYKGKKAADPEAFKAKKAEMIASLESQKRQALLDDWLSALRNQGEVSIQEGFLD
ncbi:MAG: SurA N-terminal domain-containing protein [Deltaproteobacteria bacterium]|nr:SurA N-terminal domain-containing protein [Deltaproteobacteria bacterium]